MIDARSIVIDANLLVLLVAGHTDPILIDRHKNLTAYDVDGYDLLIETLRPYSNIIVTPNALTEASNLLRQIREPDRSRLTIALAALIERSSEHYVTSEQAVKETVFLRLGLTDATLIGTARQYGTLFSADRDLCLAAYQEEGIKVLNFVHLYDAAFG